MVVYTWWCWHICKGEVREVLEVLVLKKREGMDLGLENCIDPLFLASSIHVGCVAL
jgi:hypothetical protein